MAAQDALPQPRRRQDRRLTRALAAGALTVALAVVGTSPAVANDRVVIHPSSGPDVRLDEAAFAQPDVLSEDYVLRSPSNELHQTVTGTSVARLLSDAKVQVAGFVRLTRADGTWATLDADDLKDPAPFQDGRKPVMWLDGSRVRYLRPVRDDKDVNANDNITTSDDDASPLELFVQSGRHVNVNASASSTEVGTNAAVTYSAHVDDPQGDQFTVTWDFGDGSKAQGQTVTHAFAKAGSYGAVATAQRNGSGGASGQIIVNVGDPPQNGVGPGAGSTANPSSPATGEVGSAAGGTGTGTPNQSPGSGGKTGVPGASDPTRTGTGPPARRHTAPNRRSASDPTTPVTSAPVASAGSGSGTGAAAGTAGTTRTRTSGPRHRSAMTPLPSGPFVKGVLVSATSPISGHDTGTAQRSGRERISRPGGDEIAVPVTAIAVLALLGLGLWSERRGLRRARVAPG
jgi:hypothetical protein